jgi:hypothetical protein
MGPGGWNDAANTALYYYLLDLEEEWPGGAVRVCVATRLHEVGREVPLPPGLRRPQ